MDAPDLNPRLVWLRRFAIFGLLLGAASVGRAQTAPETVVWKAKSAAVLALPKPIETAKPPEVESACNVPGPVPQAVTQAAASTVIPVPIPDVVVNPPPSNPVAPTPTATLCDPPRMVLVEPAPATRGVDWFPIGLLWEPPVAMKREARLAGIASNLNDVYSQQTMDTQIGGYFGIARTRLPDADLDVQIDLFAVVNSRFSRRDFLIASDYRAGIPLSFRRGPWVVKVAYEHTSTHLGDELIENTGARRLEYIKDEVVLGLSRVFNDRLRVYGQAGYGFNLFINGGPSKYRFDTGFEWFHRAATGAWGTPFVAANLGFRGENAYNADLTVQAGWLWRNPDKRLAQWRLYGEYYQGRSYFGQLFRSRESYAAIGIALDY